MLRLENRIPLHRLGSFIPVSSLKSRYNSPLLSSDPFRLPQSLVSITSSLNSSKSMSFKSIAALGGCSPACSSPFYYSLSACSSLFAKPGIFAKISSLLPSMSSYIKYRVFSMRCSHLTRVMAMVDSEAWGDMVCVYQQNKRESENLCIKARACPTLNSTCLHVRHHETIQY